MKVTLPRVGENKLAVEVSPNNVMGECCVNELNVPTELKYCPDMDCRLD